MRPLGIPVVVLAMTAALFAAPVRALQSEDSPSSGAGAGAEAATREDAATHAGDQGTVNSLAGPIDPAIYRVGPGDQLVLYIRGQVSRSIPLTVGPEGNVLIPDEGPIHVAGRTLADARADILQRLARRYRNVETTLLLNQPRTFRVYITGQVKAPGPMQTNGSYRVADVLANDAFLEKASHRRVTLLHGDGTRDLCDLQLFLLTGDAAWNPWLRDGDVIQVPSATEFVHVEGAVARPGKYELGPRDSLRTLLRLAGDPLPSAVPERMLVVRFRDPVVPESLWVSRDAIESGRMNLPLEDGERLYVYFMPRYRVQHQALMLGEVQRPGTYPIVEGHTRLSELVAAAGGFQPTADLSAIRVHRGSPVGVEKDPELERLLRLSRNELTSSEYEVLRTKLAGFREDYRVDWARLQADPNMDLVLRDGDSVRVDRMGSSIRVDGEVRRPGLLNYVQGETVADCVAQAGGFTNRAWQSKVRVTRAVTGQTLLARNVRSLDPGDFIWVPERTDVTPWDQFKELLTALAQIGTVIIAIRAVK